MVLRRLGASLSALALLSLAACGGGGGTSPAANNSSSPPPAAGSYTAPAQVSLSTADVQKILAQAAAQAVADGKPAVVAVVDRVGNVLAVMRMTGAPANAHIPEAPDGSRQDVQGLDVPAEAAALAKAITGAYLSSGGNAFSSRTASMIVQQHFPPSPSTVGLESGPLFGVQFSQLPCSDLAARFAATGADALIGPRLPHLTYMLSFPDMAALETTWEKFGADPDWKKLSADPRYRLDPPTVSNITSLVLRPLGYSQV